MIQNNGIKNVAVLANGCPENRNDAARISTFFIYNGYKITSNYNDADLIIFRPCGGFDYFSSEGKAIIKRIKSNIKPNSTLIICGCLSVTYTHSVKEVHQGLIFGPENMDFLDKLFMRKVSIKTVYSNNLVPFTASDSLHPATLNIAPASRGIPRFKKVIRQALKSIAPESLKICRRKFKETFNPDYYYFNQKKACSFSDPRDFYIKISTGCSLTCSYCAIRIARGKLVSRSIEEITRQFQVGLEMGHKEIALIGTNIGLYGRDRKTNLLDLLNVLIKQKGNYKIRLRNLHPKFIIENFAEFKEILKCGKILTILSSIQSGNNRILQLMKRDYTVEDIRKIFAIIKTEFPKTKIVTQFIVGFPGETENEFGDSLKLLSDLEFDFIEVFEFSPTPNTKAAEMDRQVPEEIRKGRYNKIKLMVAEQELGKERNLITAGITQ